MGLSAATALGDNVAAMLRAVSGVVAARAGVDLGSEPTRFDSSADARARLDDHDVVWVCGYLTAVTVRSGELDADVVAAPVFRGEEAAVYRSVVVARPGSPTSLADAVGSRLAINEVESWSGNLALRAHLVAAGIDPDGFADVVVTGSHRRSVEAVASGQADLAAIDHSVWADLAATEATDGLDVVDRTRDWPAPPIAIHRRVAAADRTAVVDALVSIHPGDVPGLDRFTPTDAAAYDPMLASVTHDL